MKQARPTFLRPKTIPALLASLIWAGSALGQPAADGGGAQALQAKYTALTSQLAKNEFERPLMIESTESDKSVSGNAYAVINYPFATIATAFKDPDNWCEVLILHLNTKYCRAEGDSSRSVLAVSLGKKHPQEIRDAYSLSFEGYLATMGSGKLGFTQIERQPGGPKAYVEGMRGAVERNTMRYYLAIDAYLGSLNTAAPEQLERRLQYWFDATERYPRQLREIDRNAYLTMKRSEHRRQQAGQ